MRKSILINNVLSGIVMAERADKLLICVLGFEDSVENPALLLGDLSDGTEITEITMMVCLASRCFDFAEYGPLPFNPPCADHVGNDRCGQSSREGYCANQSSHADHGQPCCESFCDEIRDRSIIHQPLRERFIQALAIEDNCESSAQMIVMSAGKALPERPTNRNEWSMDEDSKQY